MSSGKSMHISVQCQTTATPLSTCPSMGRPEQKFTNDALIGGLFACGGFENIGVKGKFLSSINVYVAPVRTVGGRGLPCRYIQRRNAKN